MQLAPLTVLLPEHVDTRRTHVGRARRSGLGQRQVSNGPTLSTKRGYRRMSGHDLKDCALGSLHIAANKPQSRFFGRRAAHGMICSVTRKQSLSSATNRRSDRMSPAIGCSNGTSVVPDAAGFEGWYCYRSADSFAPMFACCIHQTAVPFFSGAITHLGCHG